MQGVTSDDLAGFLEDRVNLKREDVKAYRDQVRHLRERLELYVREHPDFALIKMLHFGSLAKATAISTLREMDVAVYLRAERLSTHALHSVLETVRDLLIEVYPQMERSQFVIDPPAVTIQFRTSGLEVDVVPVIPNGKPDDRGELALAYPEWIETSIPLHLQFIRDRAERHAHFRELVRLTKWWRQERDVPLQSFLIELLWAHLFDAGRVPDDFQEAMLAFFAYIERTRLEERIVFADNYRPAEAKPTGDLVQVIDPVTPTNNVAAHMTRVDRDAVLRAAEAALDDVAAASSAYSKGRGITCYQRVFGPAFVA
ncbi:MAG: nucleotidyltransferase [Gemmatimonadaceae bacterium]|nr:nucleotidyltransferase [Gemmatimonadaceae bacterium]